MATIATIMPGPRTKAIRRRNGAVGGRASLTEVRFVKCISNAKLRREVDREKQRECYRLLGLGVAVFVFFLLYGWQHFQCVRLGYEIQQLKEQWSTLEEANRQLGAELATLADPQRIDALAQQEGLAAPSPQQMIRTGPALDPAAGSQEFARNLPASAPATVPALGSVPGPGRDSSPNER
jgi:cell division protein FtsL